MGNFADAKAEIGLFGLVFEARQAPSQVEIVLQSTDIRLYTQSDAVDSAKHEIGLWFPEGLNQVRFPSSSRPSDASKSLLTLY